MGLCGYGPARDGPGPSPRPEAGADAGPGAAQRRRLDGLPLLISVPAAAGLLGISRAAAYRFASAGDLPAKRLGRRVYVVVARLREFIDTETEAA